MLWWDSFYEHLMYNGVSKSLYMELRPRVSEENRKAMRYAAFITAMFGAILTVLSLSGMLRTWVFPAYLFLFVTSSVFLVIHNLYKPKTLWGSYLLSYGQCLCLLTFGLLNGTVFAPSPASNGTIFIVLILVYTFLVIDTPLRQDLTIIIFTMIYICMVHIFKEPVTYYLDTANSICVALIAIASNWLYSKRSMLAQADKHYIELEKNIDGLTGLYTKQAARVIIDNYMRKGTEGYYAIIDIDNFKNVNDTYGHDYGDDVLKKVSRCIRSMCRAQDVPARFGGDEFTVYMVGGSKEQVEQISETFRENLQNAFHGEKLSVTCSIGAAPAKPTDTFDNFFKTADHCLYSSKRDGKDRYKVAD